MAKLTLQEQAERLMQEAERSGLKSNFFFATTFHRYIAQLDILRQLESVMKEDGVIVTKEYVKGRGNVYTHPAVKEYNQTATSANGTVATLIKILDSFKGEGENNSKLQSFIDMLKDE